MNEKIARWRPFASNRLWLEQFEERWTLGGGGFLSASLGLVGASATQSGTNNSSESSTMRSELVNVGSGSTQLITTAEFLHTGDDLQFSPFFEFVSAASTSLAVQLDLTITVNAGSVEAFVGISDELDLLDNPQVLSGNLSNFAETVSNLPKPAGNDGSVLASNSGSSASIVNPPPIILQGVSNFAGSNASVDAAITRSSSSIVEGGFAPNGHNLVGNHGGFNLAPVSEEMIDRRIADLNVPRITNINRNAATMMGGWNPALRSIMVMDDGSRWFAAEQGNDVNVNSTMIYYRLGEGGWKAAGSVVLPNGIQQNMASVTDGRTILSYGMTSNSVIGIWFHTDKPGWNLNTGSSLVAGGSVIRPGPNANYVGAAWHNDTPVVWWTSVGDNGSSGRWSYTFNTGNGWKNPIVSGLGGFNDVGYVRAAFDDRLQLRLVGESYRGHYPFGEKYLSATILTLGKPASWVPVLQPTVFTPLDIWHEGSSSATQNLYRTRTDRIGYSFGLGSAVRSMTFAALDGRFVVSKDSLGLVLSYGNFLEVRVVDRVASTGFIDWNAIQPIRMGFPKSLATAGLSAIWNVDHSKQPNESKRLEFAICGAYPSYDHMIYHYSV